MFTSGFQLTKIEENGEELVLSQKGNSYLSSPVQPSKAIINNRQLGLIWYIHLPLIESHFFNNLLIFFSDFTNEKCC